MIPYEKGSTLTDTAPKSTTTSRPGVSITTAAAEPEKTSSGYSLPTALHKQLQEAARERGYSTSFLVQKALEDYLPRLIPVTELALVRPHATNTPS